jgi:hypothetical protein
MKKIINVLLNTMFQNLKLICIGTIFTLFYQCEPPEPQTELPEITQTGKNTFGCLINNEIYVPEIRRMLSFQIAVSLNFPDYPDYFLSIDTRRVVNEDDNILDAEVRFNISNVKQVGKYSIDFGTVLYNANYYHTDSINNGVVIITRIDTINKIISGTFNFIAENEYSNGKTYITDGRFDLKK